MVGRWPGIVCWSLHCRRCICRLDWVATMKAALLALLLAGCVGNTLPHDAVVGTDR